MVNSFPLSLSFARSTSLVSCITPSLSAICATGRKLREHIHFLAHHDALTGLPNRNSFNARLEKEIEAHQASSRSFAVFCLDLDRFKEVNDLFGHAAGDALLRRVAKCVTSVLDRNQMMARLGGDEFAIIATNLSSPSVAGRIAENIIEALRIEDESSTTASFVSTSIGVAIFPNDARDGRGLLTHADTALYRAKTDGRGVYRFFEAAMGVWRSRSEASTPIAVQRSDRPRHRSLRDKARVSATWWRSP